MSHGIVRFSFSSLQRNRWGWIAVLPALAGALMLFLAGCGSSNGSSGGQPPLGVTYAQRTITVTVGQAIASDTPTIDGGRAQAFTVSPTLPTGLTLDPKTGVISGTPTAVSPTTTYTVIASNNYGQASGQVVITVNPGAPGNLVYPQTTIAGAVGYAIATDTPTVTGTVSSYSVSPALPAGLSLDTTTGAISGTPTAVSASASYVVTATNQAGSTTATLQISVVQTTPPTGLTYTQATIAATVGEAIATDTPTSSGGTVTSYTVSPALPAGLSLSSTTGAISGTPTAGSALASYVVTASNPAGSTTATVQISVALQPPSDLTYPQSAIDAIVGQAITNITPTVVGTGITYSISPALPAGLKFDTATGTISGTPTAAAAVATYTVTATNSAGSTTAQITVVVNPAPSVLLELGHDSAITTLHMQGNSVFSQDYSGHWVLWNYSSGAIVARGNAAKSAANTAPWPSDMEGSTIAVGIPGAVELHSATDGHLLATVTANWIDSTSVAGWWQLASDGSYLCSGSQLGLKIWSTAGKLLASRGGDYSAAVAFAAPGAVQVAQGPAGQSVIENISTNGTSVSGAAFSGQFTAWFADGGNFITSTSSTYWVYSAASTLQGTFALQNIQSVGGTGNWLWTTASDTVTIYPITGGAAAASYSEAAAPAVTASGTTLFVENASAGSSTVTVIDLSGASPSAADDALPIASATAYAAKAASQWVLGNQHGALLDGASLSSIPRYLGTGQAWSLAGTTGIVAVSTASGNIYYGDPAAALSSIPFSSSQIALSSDGTVLAGLAETLDGLQEPDRSLKVYTLPAGTLFNTLPYDLSSAFVPTSFSLSGSGSMLGVEMENAAASYQMVAQTTSGTTAWTQALTSSQLGPYQLSPDGTMMAISGTAGAASSVELLTNGTLSATITGTLVGWLDSGRLLVNSYGNSGVFSGASIYAPDGTLLGATTLPELHRIQPVTSDLVYSAEKNIIYSLSTGLPTWTGPAINSGLGAVSGPYVIWEYNSQVLIDTY